MIPCLCFPVVGSVRYANPPRRGITDGRTKYEPRSTKYEVRTTNYELRAGENGLRGGGSWRGALGAPGAGSERSRVTRHASAAHRSTPTLHERLKTRIPGDGRNRSRGLELLAGVRLSSFGRPTLRSALAHSLSLAARPRVSGAPGRGLRLRPVTSQPARRTDLDELPSKSVPFGGDDKGPVGRGASPSGSKDTPGGGPGQGFCGALEDAAPQQVRRFVQKPAETRTPTLRPSACPTAGCAFVTAPIHAGSPVIPTPPAAFPTLSTGHAADVHAPCGQSVRLPGSRVAAVWEPVHPVQPGRRAAPPPPCRCARWRTSPRRRGRRRR
jgi:hypothetical protein